MKAKKKKRSRYSVEVGFISKLIETQDVKFVKEMQIKPNFFIGENRRVFSFISKAYLESGEFPTLRVIEQKFPNFDYETHNVDGDDVVGTDESLAFWCKEVRMKTTHNLLAETTEKLAEHLDNGDTLKAKEVYEQTFFKIEDDIDIHERTDFNKSAQDRKERYLERKKTQGMLGIPTGFDHIDYLLKGLVNDTLTTLIARTGIGKTWILVLVGAYAMLNNYKVQVFVTEMSREQMEDRFDAVLFGFMYEGFNYSDFKSGKLSEEKEDEFFAFLDNDVDKLEKLIIEDVTNVGDVIAGVRREKPDLVLVDSAYLMDDMQKSDSDWLRVAHITRALKKDVAKRFHIPVFINSQADKTTSKKTGPALENISFAQAIGQDSDNVLSAYRDDVMYADKEMGLKVLKSREGMTGKCVIMWDFTCMRFDNIYGESDSSSEVDNSRDMSDNILSVDED